MLLQFAVGPSEMALALVGAMVLITLLTSVTLAYRRFTDPF